MNEPHHHMTPELRLWGAVLHLAVRDAVKGEYGARDWLGSREVEAVCDIIGLDASAFRVRAWRTVSQVNRKKAEAYSAAADRLLSAGKDDEASRAMSLAAHYGRTADSAEGKVAALRAGASR